MSKRTYFYLIIYCITILVASCASDPSIPVMENKNEIEVFEGEEITLHIGDTVTIKLHQNGSIGGSNCWINELKCESVQSHRKWYISSEKEKQGCEGCGGNDYWSFKGLKLGIDTIKIKNCPTGRKQKNCASFHEDSISYKEDIKYSPKYNRAIIVRVVQ